jgi:homocysteine S-methyltransferase
MKGTTAGERTGRDEGAPRPGFRELLERQVLVCDGAMGTLLHAAGVTLDRVLPELNLSNPDLVREVHRRYLDAGADIIQTNTFRAARPRLAQQELAASTVSINEAGVRIARAAAEESGRPVLVAGSVGPVVTGSQRARLAPNARATAHAEQVQVLADAGVDLLLFETFSALDEMVEAVSAARDVCGLPIVAQMTFVDDERTLSGDTPAEVASELERLRVDVIGVNCTLGPQGVHVVIEQLARHSAQPLAAQPNAGLPRMIGERRFRYRLEEDYIARYARRCVDAGASLVGGCCGTTPEHIAAIRRAVAGVSPGRTARPTSGSELAHSPAPAAGDPPTPLAPRRPLRDRLAAGHYVVGAELQPPLGGDPAASLRQVDALADLGLDPVFVSPSPSPRAQMSALSLALVLQQHRTLHTVVSMTTWDRSIMSLQADLLGAQACGIESVVCRTGNPPLQGDYPNTDGIWDVDSLGLIRLVRALNEGRDSNGVPLHSPTSVTIGARVNPAADDLDAELAKARAKIDAGAHFLITWPVYDLEVVARLLDGIGQRAVPVLLTVRPLRDFHEAEYLRHEVPDVHVPEAFLDRLRGAGDRQAEVGLELACELVREGRRLGQGLILMGRDPSARDETRMLGELRSSPGPALETVGPA